MRSNWNRWSEARYSLEVWRGALKKIEGHQGMGVVSYFTFLRWLFLLNFFIFLLIFWVITFFQVAFKATTVYDTDLIGSDSKFNTTIAETCSASYTTNISSDALTLILDFFQGTGWMEDTAMFNGFYTDKKLELAASNYNMPLAYFLVTVAVMLISLVVMVHNTLFNVKNTVMPKENAYKVNDCNAKNTVMPEENTSKVNDCNANNTVMPKENASKVNERNEARSVYSHLEFVNAVFAGVDFNIAQSESMKFKQKSIRLGLVSELQEQRHKKEKKNRTSEEKYNVYTARFFVNFIIILMLGGAGVAIYYAEEYSADFTTQSDVATNNHSLVILLVQFLPSIVIGVLNGAYPVIFGHLGKLEGCRPATAIRFQLIRMVFLRLASIVMIVASLYVQITCSSDLNSCRVGDGNPCAAIQCWETYVGSAFYKLIVFDFIINVAVTLGVDGLRKLISSKCQCSLVKTIAQSEFNLPSNILDLVYSQTLLWIGIYFAPLISAVSVVCYFTIFYVKYLSAMYLTVPPEKPYPASKSNSFFTIILMVAFFMICVPVGYVLSNLEPSPMCGPFRVYSAPADIIRVQIDNASFWFSVIWRVGTSSAFVATLIILLILLVYYCTALKSAHKDMMKDQLKLEGMDKKYLFARINELGGTPTESVAAERSSGDSISIQSETEV
ncbi:transmembrane channel-like protein 7 [Dreissena polymorpha]|nr:transmembrane channel-like protein 7 [Dreissena polymorpha]